VKTIPKETIVFISITTVVSSLAVAMALLGKASWLEAVSFVTGALCVWLVLKENVWNFPLGLINSATFSVVYFETKLFADAGLQVMYFILNGLGWYMWLYGGEHRTELKVSRAGILELAILGACVALSTILLEDLLYKLGDSAPFWDGLTSSLSLASQWLTNRKRLESWIGWIIADIIYVPLYIYKDLHLTAVLYLVFLVMATMGYFAWRKSWLDRRTAVDEPQLGVPVP
jgi:nicotinamide mononucleotide transporter